MTLRHTLLMGIVLISGYYACKQEPPKACGRAREVGNCQCGVSNIESSSRIVNGADALRGELPWQVSLQKYDKYIHYLSAKHTCKSYVVCSSVFRNIENIGLMT